MFACVFTVLKKNAMTDEREGRRRDGGARTHPRLTVTRFTSSVTMPTRHSADRLLHISQP